MFITFLRRQLARVVGPRPSRRRRRRRATTAPLARLVERLEPRTMLAGTILRIGEVEQLRHVDADGDVVDVTITGAAGELELVEDVLDGIGNDDGLLEAGEVLGRAVLRNATADFVVRFEHRSDLGRGDGIVDMGLVDGRGLRIAGFVGVAGTNGESTFRAASLRIGELTSGGLVQLDEIVGDESGAGLVLGTVDAGASIRIGGSVGGRVVVSGDLLGEIGVGGALERGLVVGGNLYGGGAVDVGGAVREQFLVVGLFGGSVVAGELDGRVRVLGDVHGGARLAVAGSLTGDVDFVRSFHGDVDVEGAWRGNLTIGGAFGLGRIRTGSVLVGDVRLFGDLHGEVHVGDRTYGAWDVHGAVKRTATLFARNHFVNLRARGDFDGLYFAYGSVVLRVDGNVGNFARIGSSNSALTSVVVVGDFEGAAHSAHTVYVRAGRDVLPYARIVGGERSVVLYGGTLGAATIVAPDIATLSSTWVDEVHVLRGTGPIVITESGDYALGHDLEFAAAEGVAITILADDVTLDLAGHAIVGTAGTDNLATAIAAVGLSRVTVRNGTVRGFYEGVRLEGDENVVERIRAESNHYLGLVLIGARGRLSDNHVVDHGGSSLPAPYTVAIAMQAIGPEMIVRDNVLSRTVRRGVVEQVGLHVDAGTGTRVERNVLHVGDHEETYAMWVNASTPARGLTDATFTENVVVSAAWSIFLQAEPDETIGALRGNLILDVDFPLSESSFVENDGLDLGDNFEAP